jgi:hypothetical protein
MNQLFSKAPALPGNMPLSLALNYYYGPLMLYLDLWSNSELTEVQDHPKI